MDDLFDPTQTPPGFRSGFVALAGCPNVGKSSLLNRLVGQKVTIVADVPQTTRHRILGIRNDPETQIVFVDTPGIHKPQKQLTRVLVHAAEAAIVDVDLILFVVEPPPALVRAKKFGAKAILPNIAVGPGDEAVLKMFEERLGGGQKVLLVINKVDLVSKDHLLPFIEAYADRYPFAEIVPVSALKDLNLQRLSACIAAHLPEGHPMFPSDQVTDRDEAFRAGELIREKVLEQTRAEVPYSVAVVVEAFDDPGPPDPINIHAAIFVERDSHKGIIIGKGGSKLREIGTAARKDIQSMLGRRTYLELVVRVRKNWRNRDPDLKRFGYREE